MSTGTSAIPSEAGPAGRVRAWCVLARFFARQAIRSKRLLLAGLVLSLPAAIGVIVRAASTELAADELARFYWSTSVFMMLTTIVPLTAMIFSTTLISNEASAGTISYLFTRRVGRANVLLAKYVATSAVVAGAACLAQLALFLVAAVGPRGMQTARGIPELWGTLVVAALGGVVLSAVFVALGTFFRRPMGVAVGYLILCEWVLANVPLDIRQLSVNYYLRCILLRIIGDSPTVVGLRNILGGGETGAAASVGTLVLVAGVALTAAALIVMSKEFTRAGEEQR